MRAVPSSHAPVAPEIAEQAVKWLIELQEGPASATVREAWQRWRHEDPEHERAWQHIESVNERLKAAPEGLARAVIGRPAKNARRRALKLLLLVPAGGAGAWMARDTGWVAGWASDYTTKVGERRNVTLEDGSQVTLNTDTAIDVDFNERQRTVRLVRGEIMVATAVDRSEPGRPFIVQTVHGRLRALGTRFDVRVRDGASDLAVFEGAVELRPSDRPEPPLVLPAGQQVVLGRDGWREQKAIGEGAGAWAEGMLVALNMPLAEFLSELSRHRPGRVSCAPEVARLAVSGTYPLADTDRILGALQRALPIKIKYFTRYWVSVGPASGA